MELIIALLVIICLVVFPVKVAASMVNAGKTGFFSCLIAVIFSSIIQAVAAKFVPNVSDSLGIILTFPLAGLAYMLVLDTTFLKGLLIALIQTAIVLLVSFLFAGLLVI